MTAPTPGGLNRDGLRARLAEVIGRHQFSMRTRPNADDGDLLDYAAACTCGEWNAFDDDDRYIEHFTTALLEPITPALDKADADRAAAWDAGHADACDDHMCEQMGHLRRNPYRAALAGDA